MESQHHHLLPVNIEDEMRRSYIDYAMSVIVGRALPDVRDGLKPVHRRILYAMNELGNVHNKAYKKSARIVGDVIGKYHPHGDTAVYDTIVRMAQDFNMRYMLVDGQGNFGSIDGDNAAAMRYTEIRMARIAGELLEDIDKNTVDFGPNYDDSLTEPLVLPSRLPNLLMNGSDGIAVGMATKIPPHNLRELVKGLVAMVGKPDITTKELMRYIPGPDFPTGGFILGRDKIVEAYMTGRGVVRMRAKAHVETHPRTGRIAIIVDELPYQTNKARLIEAIANLVGEKKLEGISDLRDESDREGMRIVVELKKGENAEVLLNRLYKMTDMEGSFGMNMVALVNGEPRQIGLRDMLQEFLNFRREVIIRRTHFMLQKARDRAHILEGLVIALDNLDAVIALIRKAKDPHAAKDGLVRSFGLTEVQAQAILDMRLQRLTGLERQKIQDEYKQVLENIKDLEDILARRERVDRIIVEEMEEAAKTFGDDRRTEIIADQEDLTVEDLIADEEMVVTISHRGYIKRNPVSLYRAQHRGGRGKVGMAVRDEDFVEQLFVASMHSYILFFSSRGQLYWQKVHQLPQAGRAAKGRPIVNLLQLKDPQTEKITAWLPVREFVENRYVVMVTDRGTIKKTDLMAFSNPRASGIVAMDLEEGESLITALLTSGDDDLMIATRQGKAIRFTEREVRAMGRQAHGVRGMTLTEGDIIINAEVVSAGANLLTVAENGYGKRTSLDEYRGQGRGGKGIFTMKVTEKTGGVAGVLQVRDDHQIMLITNLGKIIRTAVSGISLLGRSTQGVRLMKMDEGETVVGVARLVADAEDEGEGGDAGDDAPADAGE